MRHWLIKSEPSAYPWSQLLLDGKTAWTGVRNPTARLNMLAMAVGDLCLFYHSNEGKEVVGIARVVGTAYRDPTADEDRWVCVDVAPVSALERTVTLAMFKADTALSATQLVKQSRLSVAALTPEEYARVLEFGRGSAG